MVLPRPTQTPAAPRRPFVASLPPRFRSGRPFAPLTCEASQTRAAPGSVPGPARTNSGFRRHLNSRGPDPSHCPPTAAAAAAAESHEDVSPLPRELATQTRRS